MTVSAKELHVGGDNCLTAASPGIWYPYVFRMNWLVHLVKFNPTLFGPDELTTLKEVVSKFGETNTREIIDISHGEEAWQRNFRDGKKLISYMDAFTLKWM